MEGIKMFTVALLLLCIALGSFAQAYQKKGMNDFSKLGFKDFISFSTWFKILTNPYVLAGTLLYLLAAGFYLVSLSKLDLSFAAPLFSLGFVLSVILGVVMLKEDVSLMRWAGVVLITLGSFLVLRT